MECHGSAALSLRGTLRQSMPSAAVDADCDPGGGAVLYNIDLGGEAGPVRVQVSLLCPVICCRWACGLERVDVQETDLPQCRRPGAVRSPTGARHRRRHPVPPGTLPRENLLS